MEATPLELSAANEFVAKLHRHHDPVHRDKFRIGYLQQTKFEHKLAELKKKYTEEWK